MRGARTLEARHGGGRRGRRRARRAAAGRRGGAVGHQRPDRLRQRARRLATPRPGSTSGACPATALEPAVSAALTPTAGVQHRHPTWSPDRTRIAYARGAGGVFDIFVQDLTAPPGTPPVNITNTPAVSEDRPAWSPDGTRIAWETNAGDILVDTLPAGGAGELHAQRGRARGQAGLDARLADDLLHLGRRSTPAGTRASCASRRTTRPGALGRDLRPGHQRAPGLGLAGRDPPLLHARPVRRQRRRHRLPPQRRRPDDPLRRRHRRLGSGQRRLQLHLVAGWHRASRTSGAPSGSGTSSSSAPTTASSSPRAARRDRRPLRRQPRLGARRPAGLPAAHREHAAQHAGRDPPAVPRHRAGLRADARCG